MTILKGTFWKAGVLCRVEEDARSPTAIFRILIICREVLITSLEY